MKPAAIILTIVLLGLVLPFVLASCGESHSEGGVGKVVHFNH